MIRHFPATVVLAGSVFVLSGTLACQRGTDGKTTYQFEGATMGTTFTVKVVSENIDASELERLRKLIEGELEDVNRKMSHYREDSELSRFNRFRDAAPFAVSPETFQVFQDAEEISRLTGGAFDVTAAPLINLWGFGPGEPLDTLPSEEAIAEARERTGYQKLALDRDHLTLRKLDPTLGCDLSAIAKGYGVDRVAEALAHEGYLDYVVEVGGEIRTAGTNDAGEAWRIAIERPVAGERALQRIVPLSGMAMATSGGYRNFYDRDGVRYSHTIDPRTGRPVTHNLASVTVVDELCARADGLATGLLVLGPDDGYALAVEHDLAVFFLVAEGDGFRERATPAFEAIEKGVKWK
jgi:thiamine biosynthesis lipoprotein